MLVSRNVHHTMAARLSGEAQIALTTDLGKYLGVPLLHRRSNKATFDSLLRKSQQRLASWKAASLSFVGRVTLAQSVVASIPTYSMQTMLLPRYVCDRLERDQRRFIWGADEGSRSYNHVAWNRVCSPKPLGGLGLKRLHEFNQAIFMKINWGLITAPDALWVRVLRHKYGCGDDSMPAVSRRPSESSIWNGVRNTWEAFSRGLRWQIGNGRTIRIWTDRWLTSGLSLEEVAVQAIPEVFLSWVLADLYQGNGRWDISCIIEFIPNVVYQEVITSLPASLTVDPDVPMWGRTAHGQFTTSSAYELLTEDLVVPTVDPLWRLLWRWKGAPRVRFFIWEVVQGGLMVNEKRVLNHLAVDDTCPLCGSGRESVLHALRDCSVVRHVWSIVVPVSSSSRFFSLDLRDWIFWNMKGDTVTRDKERWVQRFAISIWSLWRMRNDVVFNHSQWDINQVHWWVNSNLYDATRLTLDAVTGPQSYSSLCWLFPGVGWMKYNVDGSVWETGEAACGGVLRDSSGSGCKVFVVG